MHLIWAFRAFFRAFVHGGNALAPSPEAAAPPPPETAFKESAQPAVQMLGLLQKEGRLLDFLMEDIKHFSDAEVGTAVRQIHEGCRKVLEERAKLERVTEELEGAAIEVPAGFDASAISISGDVTGEGPYKGTVRHRGWKVAELSLPTVAPGADPQIAQPAEVEI